MSPPGRSRCPQCGAESAPLPSRCPACGTELAPAAAPGTEEAPNTAPFWRRIPEALGAAGETAAAIALRPETAFRKLPLAGGMAAPLAQCLLFGGPSLLLGAAVRTWLSPDGGPLTAGRGLLLALVVPPVYVYLRAQAIHLVLVMRGEAREPFEATFRITAHANASVAPLIILPYAGDFLFLAVGAAVEATGLRIGHRLSLSGAVLAELTPSIFLLIGLAAALATGAVWWSQTIG